MNVTDNKNNFNYPEDDYRETDTDVDFTPEDTDGQTEGYGDGAYPGGAYPKDSDAPEETGGTQRAREDAAGRKKAAGAKRGKKQKAEKPGKDKKKPAKKGGKKAKDTEPEPTAPPDEELPSLAEDVQDGESAKGKKGRKGKKSKKGKEPKEPRSESRFSRVMHKIKLTLMIILVVAAMLAAAAAAGGFYVTNNGVTLPNLYIGKVFVGTMDRAQVDKALEESGWDKLTAEELTVKLPVDVSFQVGYEKAGARMTREEAVKVACDYGHDKDWFTNLYKYLMNYLAPADADPEVVLDEEYIRAQIAEGQKALEKATEDKGYEIDKEREKLVIVKGAGQIRIAQDALYTSITQALAEDRTELSFDTLEGELTMPDFKKLHDTLAVEPSDAYFTENFEVVDEIDGCWFEVDEAEKLWTEAKPTEKVEIPMTLTFPEVTGEALRSMLYRDKLGAQTTYYTWSNDNRISNINKVAEKLNGHIMMPGDVFSYNDFVGQRTEEAGFLPAGAYENGQVVEEVGGGICQVSSTLYCASMYAQMETVERTSHYFRVDYLPLAQDATVSWPKPDFKFRNAREYPIKIVAYCDNEEKALTVEIWGTDVDGSYVELRHETYTRFDGTYTDVAIGYYVLGFRQVYDANGTLLYEIEEPASDYFFHEEDINWPAEKFAAPAEGG